MRPVFLMFCGLPGSGKSSMSRALKSVMAVVEEDGYLDELVNNGSYATYRKAWLAKEQEALDVCHERLQVRSKWPNTDVLFDGINLNADNRRHILNMFPQHKKIAIYWDYPMSIIHARLRARQKKTGKIIPFDVVEDMKKYYIFPTKKEGFEEVHAMTIPPLHFEDYT